MPPRAIRGLVVIAIHSSTSPEALAVRSEQFLSLFNAQGANSVSNNRNIPDPRRRFVLRKLDVVAASPRYAPEIICKSGLVATLAGIDAVSPHISEAVVAGFSLRFVVANQLTAIIDYPLLGPQVLRRKQTSLAMCWMARIGYGSNSHQPRGQNATRRRNLGLVL